MIQHAVINVTTTGVDHTRHQTIGITAIRVDTDFNAIAHFHTWVKHKEFTIEPDALAYNNVDLRQSASWPDADTVKQHFCTTFGVDVEVLHGKKNTGNRIELSGIRTEFTIRFLREFFGFAVFDQIFTTMVLDLTGMFSVLSRLGLITAPPGSRLVDLASAVGVRTDDLNLEAADSRWVAEVSRRTTSAILGYCGGLRKWLQEQNGKTG